MKKVIYLFCICFFLVSAYADEKSTQIWQQIDDLEKQKPILDKTIEYCKSELPPIKNAKKEVEEYRKKMDAIIDQNIVNTVISGGINTGFEVLGGFSGGKATELAAWIVGKAIGVGMEKTSPFGGVAYYKSKLEGISDAYKSLTPELDKLSKISKSSDEAMKSYYNKYGKYSKTFEIGDVGVFTTRMRLIVEQSDVAIGALENLHLKLFQTLDDAERDLGNINREIEILKEELKKLNNQDKEKAKEEIKKMELNENEKKVNHLPEVKAPTISVPGMPGGCDKAAYFRTPDDWQGIYDTLDNIRNSLIDLNKKINDISENISNEQDAYLKEVKDKYGEIKHIYDSPGKYFQYTLAGGAHEDVKKGIYPTGAPFSYFLRDTKSSYEGHIKKIILFNTDLKTLTENMVINLPVRLNKSFAEAIANRDAFVQKYNVINTQCLDSWHRTHGLPGFPNSSNDTVLNQLISLKSPYFKELQESKNLEKIYPAWHNERISILETYFAKRRGEMKEEISRYESSIAVQNKHREEIINNIQKLLLSYKTSSFTKASGSTSYQFVFQTKMQDTVCKTINAIRAELNSGVLSSTISLEKKIKKLFSMDRLYGTQPFPLNAYIEHGVDTQALQNIRNTETLNYSSIVQQYNTSGSNAQSLEDHIVNNKFYQLGLFYPNSIFKTISDKQIKTLQGIKNLIKNFKVEISSAIESPKITEDTERHFKEYYKGLQTTFKENFACMPLDHELSAGLIEEIEALESKIAELNTKPKFMDAQSLINDATKLLEKVKNFSIDIDHPKSFLADYQAIIDEHNKLHEAVNTTYVKQLFEIDKKKINEILLEIEPYFGALEDHKKFLSEQGGNTLIEELYKSFAQEYSNKNLSSLMSLLSDEWMSSSDGTTLMDLEETLGNSFSIFNEVKCTIDSLTISSAGVNTYRVTYVVTIQGENYENDIKHVEKSSVNEEVKIIDGKPKISQTLSGSYWKTR